MKAIIFALLMAVLAPWSALAETIELTSANSLTFRGVVTPDSVQKAQEKMAGLVLKRGSRTYPIYLVLDSPGGSIDAGLTFIEYAKTIPNVKTITIFSASMASAIVEALPGERLMIATGTFMFHRAYGGVEGFFEDGELEQRLAHSKMIVLGMENSNAKRLGISIEDYKKKVRNEWWAFGFGAVLDKMADRVVSVKCASELIERKYTETVNMMFFQATLEYSECPLFRLGKPVKQQESAL